MSYILNAAILAGGATLAASPSAEWVQQLKQLEARFEGKLTVLQERVASLEDEVQRLRKGKPAVLQAATAPLGKPPQNEPAVLNATVGPLGEALPAPKRRKLATTSCECIPCGSTTDGGLTSGVCDVASNTCSASVSGSGCYTNCASTCDCATNTCTVPAAPTCCRLTAGDTCGNVDENRKYKCTYLHEYLEHKTTTVEFEDLDACLGSDESKWAWQYDGAAANQLTLSNDAMMAALKTPLKVTHAADCGNVAPTLTVQMDTVFAGTLSVAGDVEIVGGLTVGSPTCIKVQVATVTWADGFITLSVRDSLTPDYPGRVVTTGWAEKGEVVVETCFNGFRQLLVHNDNSDGWAGTIYYSSDGGTTYDHPLLCLADDGGFCKLESTSSSVYTGAHWTAAGTSDGVWADKDTTTSGGLSSGLVCDKARRCSFAKPNAQTCMKLDVTNEGFLKVRVIDSRSTSATDWKAVTDDNRDSAVLSTSDTLAFCFDGFQKLGVSNTDSNGINFDLTVSTDAGVLYNKFMNCAGCHSDGSQQGGVAKIAVDGDAGSSGHDTAGMICEDGNWCELTVA